jgi:hypothetical protein
MVVTCPGSDEDLDREVVINDPKAVERFLAFLEAHNGGWHKPWGTFPTPRYTVALKRDNALLLAIWVGGSWIGGREGSGDSGERLRILSETERAEVLGILGVLPSDSGVAVAPVR